MNVSPSFTCPVCGGRNHEALYPEYEGPCITSDYAVLPHAGLANRCCSDCGLIFNASGTRRVTEAFYRDSYQLMLRSEGASIQSFAGPKPISQAERSLQILESMATLGPSGRILEVGAGSGEFLDHFRRTRPLWRLSALEPSASYERLRDRDMGLETLVRGGYADLQGNDQRFDLVVALGVLEHVENPLDMLKWGDRLLKKGGLFFIRVPNFARNPNDLFCADHLSKLTPSTLRALAAHAGFEEVGLLEEGVPVFLLLRRNGRPESLENVFSSNVTVARDNARVAAAGVDAVVAARRAARDAGERFGIFGLGASGLFAPLYAGFPAADISAYIDENRTIHGTTVHGRPVGGLDMIESLRIRHVALAVSPVYVPRIRDKLLPYGVQVYAGA